MILVDIWETICTTLLPRLEECLQEPLTVKLTQLVGILEIVRIEEHLPQGHPRRWVVSARIAGPWRVSSSLRLSMICPRPNC